MSLRELSVSGVNFVLGYAVLALLLLLSWDFHHDVMGMILPVNLIMFLHAELR